MSMAGLVPLGRYGSCSDAGRAPIPGGDILPRDRVDGGDG